MESTIEELEDARIKQLEEKIQKRDDARIAELELKIADRDNKRIAELEQRVAEREDSPDTVPQDASEAPSPELAPKAEAEGIIDQAIDLTKGLAEGTMNFGARVVERGASTAGNIGTFFGDYLSDRFTKIADNKRSIAEGGEDEFILAKRREKSLSEGQDIGSVSTRITEADRGQVRALNLLDEENSRTIAEVSKNVGDFIASWTRDSDMVKTVRDALNEELKAKSTSSVNPFGSEGTLGERTSNAADMIAGIATQMATMVIAPPVAMAGIVADTEADYVKQGQALGLSDEEINENKTKAVAASSALAFFGDKLKVGKIPLVGPMWNKISKTVLGKIGGISASALAGGGGELAEKEILDSEMLNTMIKTGRYSEDELKQAFPDSPWWTSPDFVVGALFGGAPAAVDVIMREGNIPLSDNEQAFKDALNDSPEKRAEIEADTQEANIMDIVHKVEAIDSDSMSKLAKKHGLDPELFTRGEDSRIPDEVLNEIDEIDAVNEMHAQEELDVINKQKEIKEINSQINDSESSADQLSLIKKKKKLEKESKIEQKAIKDRESIEETNRKIVDEQELVESVERNKKDEVEAQDGVDGVDGKALDETGGVEYDVKPASKEGKTPLQRNVENKKIVDKRISDLETEIAKLDEKAESGKTRKQRQVAKASRNKAKRELKDQKEDQVNRKKIIHDQALTKAFDAIAKKQAEFKSRVDDSTALAEAKKEDRISEGKRVSSENRRRGLKKAEESADAIIEKQGELKKKVTALADTRSKEGRNTDLVDAEIAKVEKAMTDNEVEFDSAMAKIDSETAKLDRVEAGESRGRRGKAKKLAPDSDKKKAQRKGQTAREKREAKLNDMLELDNVEGQVAREVEVDRGNEARKKREDKLNENIPKAKVGPKPESVEVVSKQTKTTTKQKESISESINGKEVKPRKTKTQSRIDKALGVTRSQRDKKPLTQKQMLKQGESDSKKGKRAGIKEGAQKKTVEFLTKETVIPRTNLEIGQRARIRSLKSAIAPLSKKAIDSDQKLAAIDEAVSIFNDALIDIDPKIRKSIDIPKLRINARMKPETIEKKLTNAVGKLLYAENTRVKQNAVAGFVKAESEVKSKLESGATQGIVADIRQANRMNIATELVRSGATSKLPNRLKKVLYAVSEGAVDISGLNAQEINILTAHINEAVGNVDRAIKLARQASKNKSKSQAEVTRIELEASDRSKVKNPQDLKRERGGFFGTINKAAKAPLDLVRNIRKVNGKKHSVMEEVLVEDMRDGQAQEFTFKSGLIDDIGKIDGDYDVANSRKNVTVTDNGRTYTQADLMSIYAYSKSEAGMDRLAMTEGVLSDSEIESMKPIVQEISDLTNERDTILYNNDGHKRTDESLRDSEDDLRLFEINAELKLARQEAKKGKVDLRKKAEDIIADLTGNLTIQEKKIVMDTIKLGGGKMYDISNTAYQGVNGGASLGKRDNYFKLENIDNGDTVNTEGISDLDAFSNFGKRGAGLEKGFTKGLTDGPVAFKSITGMDFFKTRNGMVNDVSRYAGMAMPAISAKNYLKASEKAINSVDANAYKVLSMHIDGAIRGRVESKDTMLDNVANHLMGLHALRSLGYGAKVMVMQGPSMMLALPHTTSKDLARNSTKALVEMASHGWSPENSAFVNNVYSKDPTMKARSGLIEVAIKDMRDGLTEAKKRGDNNYINAWNTMNGKMLAMGEFGMGGIRNVDAYASSAVWTSAYDTAIANNKSEVEAVRAGRRAVSETQPMSDMLSRSGIQQMGAMARSLAPYASQRKQLLNMWAEVLGPNSGLSKTERAKQLTGLMISQSMITGIQNAEIVGLTTTLGLVTSAVFGEEDATEQEKSIATDYVIRMVEDAAGSAVTSVVGGDIVARTIKFTGDKVRNAFGVESEHDWILKNREIGSGLLGGMIAQLDKGFQNGAEMFSDGVDKKSANEVVKALNVFTSIATNNLSRPFIQGTEAFDKGDLRYLFWSKYIVDKARDRAKSKTNLSLEDLKQFTQDFKQTKEFRSTK